MVLILLFKLLNKFFIYIFYYGGEDLEDIKISVVVPVYNTEKYISECLDSLINQTLKEIEIICINDGSTDKSLEILNDYAKKDHRIKVFSQFNRGLGATRNMGIEKVSGKYIYFLDSDDFLDLRTFEELYNCAEDKNLDIAIFQLINYDDETKEYYDDDYYNMDFLGEKVKDNVFSYGDISDILFDLANSACNKLYRREFILNCNAKFSDGLIFEDNVFYLNVMLNAERIYFLKKHFYKRRRRKNSITSSNNEKYMDVIEVTDEVFNAFKELNLFDEFKGNLYNYKIGSIYLWFSRIGDEYKNSFYLKIKEHIDFIAKNEEIYEEYMDELSYKNKNVLNSFLKSNNLKEFDLLNTIFNLEIENNSLRKKNQKLKKQNQKLKKDIKAINSMKNDILNSKSWKLTHFFRILGFKLRKVFKK